MEGIAASFNLERMAAKVVLSEITLKEIADSRSKGEKYFHRGSSFYQ